MAAKQDYCFFPNGHPVEADTPCFPDAEVSSCCRASGWTCLANGLCYEPASGVLSRGTCSDFEMEFTRLSSILHKKFVKQSMHFLVDIFSMMEMN